MLQKIFRRGRNSFTRSSTKDKDENNTKISNSNQSTRLSLKRPKLFHSKSLDESTLSGGTRSVTPPPLPESECNTLQNGNGIRKAPLAGKDDSFDGGVGCGDESSKKVHFISPNGTLDNLTDGGGAVDEKLFDDGMMKAFEVGNLSIQEFLESPHTSPDTPPDTTLIKKSRDLINSCSSSGGGGKDLARSKSLPVSPAKKPSLLDQAHAKAGSKTARLPTASSPAQSRDKVRTRRDFSKADSESENTKSLNEKPALKKSHRFSKSLEHLAQQVFGDTEFERQLEKATERLVKVPIVDKQEGTVQEDLCHKENANMDLSLPITSSSDGGAALEISTMNCPKSEPVNRKLLDVGGSAPQRRTIQRCQSAVQQSELRVGTTNQQKHEMTKSVDFPSPDGGGDTNEHEKLESWVNKLDLSSSRASSINADSTVNLRGSTRTMDPVIEDVPLKSPLKPTSTEDPFTDSVVAMDDVSGSIGKDRQRAKSEGCVRTAPLTANLLQQRFKNGAKLVKSDSNAATCGSDLDLNASVNSILDLNFPPPPPVVDLKNNSAMGEGEGASLDDSLKHEVQEHTMPFDWEVLSSDGGEVSSSQDYIETHLPLPSSDPLTDSLFSVVPLPEDPAQLRPALTRALSEIVSEIIGARHKLNRILRAIEIHQQILKDQSKQINVQTHQIAELRFAHLELTNFPTISSDKGGVKLRPKMRRNHSTDSSSVTNSTANKKSNMARRRPQSARTYRQSREMADLSNTLDNLIDQCSEMQTSPRSVTTATTTAARKAAFLKSKILATTRNSSSSSSATVKRSHTFPSREHVPTLKRIEGSNDNEF